MIILPSVYQEEKILEVSSNWEAATVAPQIVLFIGDKNYSERLLEGEWGQGEEPAITLTANVAGRLPRSLENAPVRLYIDYDGIMVPQMIGYVSKPVPQDDGTTDQLLAASLGALLGKVTLDIPADGNGVRLLEFYSQPPENIIWNMLTRLPYDLSRVTVEPVGGPLLTYAGFEGGFRPEQTALDGLSRVLENVSYTFRDTAQGGHEAKLESSLANINELPIVYQADEIKWIAPTPKDEQWTSVEVFQYLPDGSDAFRERADVYHVNPKYKPVNGQILHIPFDDFSAQGQANARQYARNVANDLRYGTYSTDIEIPFAPLMARGDVFGVAERVEDDDGTWERLWLCLVDTYKHPFSGEYISTGVTCSATILKETLLKIPRINVGNVSVGVATTPRYKDTGVRVSFPTPIALPEIGPDLQEFKVLVRKKGLGRDPRCTVKLWQNGVLIAALVGDVDVTSTTGQLISARWDAALLPDKTGAKVECEVIGASTEGGSVEVGAIEWNSVL